MTRHEHLGLIRYLINLAVGKETGGLAAVDQLKPTHLPAHFSTHVPQTHIAVDRSGRNNHNQLGTHATCGFGAKKWPYQGEIMQYGYTATALILVFADHTAKYHRLG